MEESGHRILGSRFRVKAGLGYGISSLGMGWTGRMNALQPFLV